MFNELYMFKYFTTLFITIINFIVKILATLSIQFI